MSFAIAPPGNRPRSLPRTIPHAPSWRYRRNSRRTLGLARSERLFGYEAIADARDRVNVVRFLGVALDLLAQAVDVGIHGTGLDLDLVAPHLAQQFAAAHHLAGRRGPQRSKVEFGQGQRNLFALAPDLAAVHVDDEAWELEARFGQCLRALLLACAQGASHTGQDLQ